MKKTLPYRIFCAALSMVLGVYFAIPVQAQGVLNLPVPGTVVPLTSQFAPATIRGVNIHPDNPFQFDFIIDKGDSGLTGEAFSAEAKKLVKYFLASLTVPEKEMWVNLSPYEKNRIIPETFGTTEMGRDLLAQDYLLKQIMASLMNPEADLGGEFWKRVYSKVQDEFGTIDIPINTFNKIWIVPEEAVVYEHEKGAFIVKSHLKVMLEEDYLALEANKDSTEHGLGDVQKEDLKVISGVQSEIIRDLLIPEIEKEVNEGKTFANLRQIYNAVILSSWYKKALKESLLGQVYIDQKKVKGIEADDKNINEKIFTQYVESFKKGVYNYIKEDYDPETQEDVPRKYFSGGANLAIPEVAVDNDRQDFSSVGKDLQIVSVDLAMLSSETVRAVTENSSIPIWGVSALLIGMGIISAVAHWKEKREQMIEQLAFRGDSMPKGVKAKLLTSIRDKKVLADIAQKTHSREIRQRVMQALVGLRAGDQIRKLVIDSDQRRKGMMLEKDTITDALLKAQSYTALLERSRGGGDANNFLWNVRARQRENDLASKKREISQTIAETTDLYEQSMQGLKSLRAVDILKELAGFNPDPDEQIPKIRKDAIEALASLGAVDALVELAVAPSANENLLFLAISGLGMIRSPEAALALVKLFSSPSENERGNIIVIEEIGKFLSSGAVPEFTVTESDPEKESKLYWNAFVGSRKAPKNIQKMLSIVQDLRNLNLIKTPDDLNKFTEDLVVIVGLTKGVEDITLTLIRELMSLIRVFPSAWAGFIKPVVYNQTVGSYLVFRQIRILRAQKAINSQVDLDFLLELIRKQGVRAADVLENFIVPGVEKEIMAKPISEESQALITYFSQERAYPIIEVYDAYKNDPAKLEELTKKCRDIHQALLSGDVREYQSDPLFSAMQMYVFPPEVTSNRDMYGQITSHREDRGQDIDIIPAELRKTELQEILTGDYVLRDTSKPLDATPWSTILEVVKEENEKAEHKMSDEEVVTLGKETMGQWQAGKLAEKKRDLLLRLYRYYLARGGTALPQDLNSVRNIMALKEFAGDTLRDNVADVLKKYAEADSDAYGSIVQKMFKGKIENPKAAAGRVKGILDRFRENPSEGKAALGRALKISDSDAIDLLWSRLEGLSESREIEGVLAGLELKVQAGKEAAVIARQLLGEEMARMQGEFSAKYEFNEGPGKISLRFEISKRQAHGVAGLNMGVCVAPDKQLWDNPNFMNVIIWDQEGIAHGGMHILLIEDNGKKYVSLPGINPSTRLLSRVNTDDIYSKLIDYALKISQALGYDGVLIPTASGIHSNRSEIQRVIQARRYKIETLSNEHQFSYSPHPYTFNTAFVADRAMMSEKMTTTQKAPGGIDLNPTMLKTKTINHSGRRVIIPVPSKPIPNLNRIEGFVPNIIQIVPISNLPLLLGAQKQKELFEVSSVSNR